MRLLESTMARLRAIDSIPRVTTNGGTPTYAIMMPFNAPTSSDAPSASGIATQMDVPAFIVMPITMPDSTSTAPTERSMPPVMMTAVMPIAMMATNAKLRVTLNRFCWVAKTSLANESTVKAMTAATDTQKVCWLVSQLSQL